MSVNLGRVAFVAKGAYDADVTYQQFDYVAANNGSYVYVNAVPMAGIPVEDAAYWQPLLNPEEMNAATQAANTAAAAATEAVPNLRRELDGKAPAIYADASGKIVTITDGAEGIPVKSLITHITPAEDGSGWDTVNVTCTGKNLFGGAALADRFQEVVSSVKRDDEAGTISFSAASMSNKVFFADFQPDTQYTIMLYGRNSKETAVVANLHIRYTDGTIQRLDFSTAGENSFAVYTTTLGKTVESLKGSYNDGTTILCYDRCGIFEGVLTDADFVAYQGKTLSAALPETVAEGSYDWIGGVLIKADGSTVQLEKQAVSTVKGTNHFRSNAGDISVTYAADTGLYIHRKIAEMAAAE